MISHPLTLEKRKKLIGERIKAIRTKNRYTQPAFGELVSPESPADKRVVYSWEQGKFLPSEERLNNIALLGETTVDEIKYGTIGDYIEGIFLYADSLLIEKNKLPIAVIPYISDDTKDITLREFIQIIPLFGSASWDIDSFDKLDKSDKLVVIKLIKDNAFKDEITYFDIDKILFYLKNSINKVMEGTIDLLVNPILSEIDSIDEFISDELYENQRLEESEYPVGAVIELNEAIETFKHKLSTIKQKYTKKNGGV